MIHGIGTDLVAVARLRAMWERHGERTLDKLLAPAEHADCRASADPARFLAKRFAAKEALGKALGTGIRAPVLLPAIAVTHDALGKPAFAFDAALAGWIAARRLVCHVSLSDEADYAQAFVVTETVVSENLAEEA
jgi:holo-[acyl-carrier protein] synthase